MKKYRIVSMHSIHVDSYEHGEQEFANEYSLDEIISAESPMEAVGEYFGKVLGYEFDKDSACLDDDRDNVLYYDVTICDDSTRPTQDEIELWKAGKKVLYNDNIMVIVNELVPVKL